MNFEKILRFAWEELIYGAHLLAIGAAALVVSAALLVNIKISWDYPIIIYLIAYSSYLFNRYKEIEKDSLTNPERTQHLAKYVKYVPVIIWCIFIMIIGIVVYLGKLFAVPFIIILFGGGLLYTVLFKKMTTEIVAFKNFFVALEWTLPVIFLPVYYSFPFRPSLFLVITLVSLKTFIVNCYFDLKDIKIDKEEGLLTLPITLNPKRYLRLSEFLTFLFSLIVILGVWSEIVPVFSYMLLLTVPLNLYVFETTQRSTVESTRLYLIASAEFIFWPILLLIGRFII